LLTDTLDSLDGKGKLLDTHSPPKLNYEETGHLTDLQLLETESVIKSLPAKKSFAGEFYHGFREKNQHQSLNSSQMLRRREHFLTLPVKPALP